MEISTTEWVLFGLSFFGFIYGNIVVNRLRKDNTFSSKK
jgi:hypothetical protein